MIIQLVKPVPQFLEKEKTERSQVWNRDNSFRKGEKIQIIAASGSGKTSLINFLYGMRKDYEGSILIDQQNIAAFTAEDFSKMRRQQVSIIFQDLRLFPTHTVLQNLQVKKDLHVYENATPMEQMLSELGIQNKIAKPVNTCSYGEQQRIAIIRALQQPFDFLLMDEPFSHLDERNREKAASLIERETAKRSAGVILADLKESTFFKADRTLQL